MVFALAAAVAGGFHRPLVFDLTPGSYEESVRAFALGTRDVDVDARSRHARIPYILPGPADAWAGSGAHSLRLNFLQRPGLRLKLDLYAIETHDVSPPLLVVSVNTAEVARVQTARGTGLPPPHTGRGTHSLYHVFIPASRVGEPKDSVLSLTDEVGSWIMWERIRLGEAGWRFAIDHLGAAGALPPVSSSLLGASLVALLAAGADGREKSRLRAAVLVAGAAFGLLLLGLSQWLPARLNALASLPRWLWLDLPWILLAATAAAVESSPEAASSD